MRIEDEFYLSEEKNKGALKSGASFTPSSRFYMAHQLLPYLVILDSAGFAKRMQQEDASEKMTELLRQVESDREPYPCIRESETGQGAAKIAVGLWEIGSVPVLLFTFPEPLRPLEVWFTALAAPNGDFSAWRYFTLEKTVRLDAARAAESLEYTRLGEWTRNGHYSHPLRPQPDADSFLNAIEVTLS